MPKRIIAHLDMDAFFASVEEANTSSFLGKPIVVGSDPDNGRGRGVVSTANYRAREYGIKSALPISIAWKLSEEAKKQGKEGAIFLPVDFTLYNKVSLNVSQIILKYSSIVEQASIDEFYFDLSFTNDFKKAQQICENIKQEIKEKERVTCSIGIGPNRLISKISAGIKKPNGLFVVHPEDVKKILDPLSIRELPGIGPKTGEFLNKKEIYKIKDLLKYSKEQFIEMLGKNGESIFNKARGIDESPVSQFHQVKSIGEQTTFSKNSLEPLFIHNTLKKLSDSVFDKFKKSEFSKFKTITLTVRFANFQTKTTSKSFREGFTKISRKKFDLEVLRLLLPYLDKRSNPQLKPLRLIGIRVENLNKN